MRTGATISPCERYRYSLWREWGEPRLDGPQPNMTFVMLNPSTADHNLDDPTIRRCIGFAKREGCTGITVVNLYALRATNPDELTMATDPVGPENQGTLIEVLESSAALGWPVVAAWGAWWTTQSKTRRGIPRLTVESIAKRAGLQLSCLGTTKGGDPRHPLYVRGDAPLVPWPSS